MGLIKLLEKGKRPSRLFIFDSCVIQDLGSSEIKQEITPIIKQILKDGFKTSISQYSIYELLRHATRKVENERREALNSFKRYHISEEVLVIAALLYTLYKNEDLDGGIDDGDKIIAATAISINATLLTRNPRHFPAPLFDDMNEGYFKKTTIDYDKQKKRPKTTYLHFLKPDYEAIQRKMTERK